MYTGNQIRMLAAAVLFSLTITQSNKLVAQLNNVNGVEQKWKTDLSATSIPLNEFKVLLLRDGIPPIDRPRFLDGKGAKAAYFIHEPVLAFETQGIAKAYPLSVLMWHEIVNDHIGETYFSITYCPLCNAGIAYNRELTVGKEKYLLDFGVSGMLRNSDMVMWDRQTETWWQQFTGEGLVGRLSGVRLEPLPVQLISLKEFLGSYPDGLVLSTNTGIERRYGQNPYVGYDDVSSNTQPRLFDSSPDDRLPAVERVVDICIGEDCTIYPFSVLADMRVIADQVGGEPVVLFFTSKTVSPLDQENIAESKAVGSTAAFSPLVDDQHLTFREKDGKFIDRQTGSTWVITGVVYKRTPGGKATKAPHLWKPLCVCMAIVSPRFKNLQPQLAVWLGAGRYRNGF